MPLFIFLYCVCTYIALNKFLIYLFIIYNQFWVSRQIEAPYHLISWAADTIVLLPRLLFRIQCSRVSQDVRVLARQSHCLSVPVTITIFLSHRMYNEKEVVIWLYGQNWNVFAESVLKFLCFLIWTLPKVFLMHAEFTIMKLVAFAPVAPPQIPVSICRYHDLSKWFRCETMKQINLLPPL